MEIEDDGTIIFHSDPENFDNEKTDKCFTIRELEGEELREFKESKINKIVIINNDSGETIERAIAGILQWRTEYATRPNKTSYWREDYAFWWVPEPKKRGRKPMGDGEDAVIEKRM